jgi:hypothetical protein
MNDWKPELLCNVAWPAILGSWYTSANITDGLRAERLGFPKDVSLRRHVQTVSEAKPLPNGYRKQNGWSVNVITYFI